MANEAHCKYLGAHLHSEYSWRTKIGDHFKQNKAIRSNVHNKINFHITTWCRAYIICEGAKQWYVCLHWNRYWQQTPINRDIKRRRTVPRIKDCKHVQKRLLQMTTPLRSYPWRLVQVPRAARIRLFCPCSQFCCPCSSPAGEHSDIVGDTRIMILVIDDTEALNDDYEDNKSTLMTIIWWYPSPHRWTWWWW